jgi:S-DNA-T family DNA segregation ATPase FtsK/SpoIIIE
MTTHSTATLPAGQAHDLQATLAAHSVAVEYIGTDTGPSVSLHAFALQPGVSVAKFTALARDLAVAVGVPEVRLHAPIEGTTHVGIEVPNTARATVDYATLRADNQTDLRHNQAGALPFPIGVDIAGEAVWSDLATAPHVLIAGTTGSGKSVAVSGLIASLIEHRTPAEVRLHLIDPKRVELGQFRDAPHVERVVTTRSEAAQVLEDAVDLMNYRYEQLEENGFRNIGEWLREAAHNENLEPWAYHVIVIDELADLMMSSAAKEVEANIVRIAQLARAAGIHLVLATQRPTVNVVTGLIKANVPSRWAFTVASGTDSKVILDTTGAQALTSKGDSLWLPSGTIRPVRVQAAYITDAQVDRIVADAVTTYATPTQELSGSRADDGTEEYQGVPEPIIENLVDSLDDVPNDGSVWHIAPRVRDRSESWLDTPAEPKPEPAVHRTTTYFGGGHPADGDVVIDQATGRTSVVHLVPAGEPTVEPAPAEPTNWRAFWWGVATIAAPTAGLTALAVRIFG